MAYEDRDMSGSLFINDRKEPGSTHPDRTGYIVIGGKKWSLAGWLKDGKKGKFLSLKASEPRTGRQDSEPPPSDESIPGF